MQKKSFTRKTSAAVLFVLIATLGFWVREEALSLFTAQSGVPSAWIQEFSQGFARETCHNMAGCFGYKGADCPALVSDFVTVCQNLGREMFRAEWAPDLVANALGQCALTGVATSLDPDRFDWKNPQCRLGSRAEYEARYSSTFEEQKEQIQRVHEQLCNDESPYGKCYRIDPIKCQQASRETALRCAEELGAQTTDKTHIAMTGALFDSCIAIHMGLELESAEWAEPKDTPECR